MATLRNKFQGDAFPTEPGGEKTYTCAECAKTFTGNLKKHVLTHFGDKPHKCADCGKAFAQAHPQWREEAQL